VTKYDEPQSVQIEENDPWILIGKGDTRCTRNARRSDEDASVGFKFAPQSDAPDESRRGSNRIDTDLLNRSIFPPRSEVTGTPGRSDRILRPLGLEVRASLCPGLLPFACRSVDARPLGRTGSLVRLFD
jgi:hypothetical protein